MVQQLLLWLLLLPRLLLAMISGAVLGCSAQLFLLMMLDQTPGPDEWPIAGLCLGAMLGITIGIFHGKTAIPRHFLAILGGMGVGVGLGILAVIVYADLLSADHRKLLPHYRLQGVLMFIPGGIVCGGTIGFLIGRRSSRPTA
jgi:ABC-type enterobactin transport system permease subunit